MNYQEVLDFLYGSLPMFQRVGKVAFKKDLSNILTLCRHLDNPHEKFNSVHIAGTNGKGSTAHTLAAILQSAGYKTGLYTSPHLKEFTERIKINGKEISRAEVVDFVSNHIDIIDKVKPSFFEMTVAMAFDHFAKHKVDIAVIETGLGGRLDSTNIITPVLSLITNISLDHTGMLGDTLMEIAKEKAGIIKKETPVIISEFQDVVDDVFEERARMLEVPLYFGSAHFQPVLKDNRISIYKNETLFLENINLSLKGDFQLRNIAGVLQSIDILNKMEFEISEEHIIDGLENVTDLTNFKGRWQVLSNSPLMICDIAHNEAGVKVMMHQIANTNYDKLFIVWGMVKDKDVDKILGLLPKEASYFFCEAKIPRALDASALYEKAVKHELKGEVVSDVNEAITTAKNEATERDLIFIGGSAFVVAEIDGH